jgi:hypothetical protein
MADVSHAKKRRPGPRSGGHVAANVVRRAYFHNAVERFVKSIYEWASHFPELKPYSTTTTIRARSRRQLLAAFVTEVSAGMRYIWARSRGDALDRFSGQLFDVDPSLATPPLCRLVKSIPRIVAEGAACFGVGVTDGPPSRGS